MKIKLAKSVLLAGTIFGFAQAMPAFAQSNPTPETTDNVATPRTTEPEDFQGDIVVTGTLLRGVAAPGSQVIALGEDQITATGATTTSDLLRSIPAAGTFTGFVGVRGASNFSLAVNRTILRYLGNVAGSTSSTLLLVDGHRLPGMGVLQTSADLDAIAPASISRVEIVTDGGSSTYGSDAVGGVINFITRRDFDGADARVRVGIADGYSEFNASLMVGTAWEGGSAYVAYDYSTHDSLFGSDRDWSQSLDWINTAALGAPIGSNNQCVLANIQIGGATYALPGLTQGIGNRCDNSEFQTIYPEERKHTMFASLVLDTGGAASFRVTGYYLNRENHSDGGPFVGSVSVPTTSPFYIPVPGRTGAQTALFSLSPLLGNSSDQDTSLETFGITPTFRYDLGSNWRVNVLVNYGVGRASFLGPLLNPAPIATATAAGTFNPYNLNAASNATTLAAATNWFQFGRGESTILNSRLVIDGALLRLPAGRIRVAGGAEYLYERYSGSNSRGITSAGLAALTDRTASRRVQAVFGEINIPLLGQDLGIFHDLSINGSIRYDEYSDFGDTVNPRIAVNFQPVEWITIRGNWNRAFQAPGLSDIALAAVSNLSVIPLSVRPFADPTVPAGTTNNNTLVVLGGSVTPLQPQKAEVYSFGGDIRPPFLPGLALGATYYNIDFRGQIGVPPIFTPSTFYRQFPNNYVIYTAGNPAMQAFLNQLAAISANPSVLAQLPNGINSVYAVIDSRASNLANVFTDGIDFYARYRLETGFGAITAGVAGSYILGLQNQANPNAPLIDVLAVETTRLRVSSNIGAEIGNLRGQVTWEHSQGFPIIPTAANLQQSRVESFNLFNLFLQYNAPSESRILRNFSFTLNVQNIFDTDPPLLRGAANQLFGASNGFTIGRVVQFGINRSF